MTFDLSPLLPAFWLAAFAGIAAVLVALALMRGVRGAWIRAAALAALIVALLNPVLYREDRAPLSSIVSIIVDRSQSQRSQERTAQTDATLAALQDQLARHDRFDVRVVESTTGEDEDSPSTRLFETLASSIQDVPTARFGGAIMITDGQVHDVPESASALGFNAPVHALVTGRPDETDRRVEMVEAPRFGIVGEDQSVSYRVVDDGLSVGDTASVDIRLNGQEIATETVTVGEERMFQFEVPHGGNNILEFETAVLDGEITAANNKTVMELEGIRENLRVLLVSGEPHAGERAWRNLLKSDASVDLVHFTILRPPEKQDGTPINELSLIAFPTRELFVEKINEFDLIVFDRYQRRGVLPVLYYDYIAQYVDQGGALLIAAGPEHAGTQSIASTPLAPILPAVPTGDVTEVGFHPRLSDDGRKHPVTRDLQGGTSEPPDWGRWFRAVEVDEPEGDTILNGPDGEPLLVLDRVGEGRVAMLLSDHGWLWARGFEGGGPHTDLYRRVAHWLMKEPALEEEALTATARGRTLQIERQTMEDEAAPVTVTRPTGEAVELELTEDETGLFTAELPTEEVGLFEVASGDLTALAHVGAVNAPEFRGTVSTTERLDPLATETGGTVRRVSDGDGALVVPSVLPVRGAVRDAGGGRIGLRITDETVLRGVDRYPLFAGFLGLAALLLALGGTWYREGR
ncbi:hypothetical protein [Pararhizobium haloflavum]|uniref:hypothetical protein n=1 Tax=Pararhizobium haloflavum TaxID=2037914 RepID=UPI000C186CDB|nr:hypothetical protein [Pararhizobium haloflavum]